MLLWSFRLCVRCCVCKYLCDYIHITVECKVIAHTCMYICACISVYVGIGVRINIYTCACVCDAVQGSDEPLCPGLEQEALIES